MFSTRTRVGRASAATVAIAGLVGLSACNSNEVSTSTPSAPAPATSTESSQAPSTSESPSTTEAPSTTESSSTTESPSSTESSSSSSESSSSSATATGADPKAAPRGATFKIGEPAVINTGSASRPQFLEIKPTALEKQPDSIFDTERGLKKTNGTVYFLKFDVKNLKAEGSVSTSSVNGLFFHPKAPQGGKRLYGNVSGCRTEYKRLQQGDSGSACYIYQITGSETKDVVFTKSDTNVTWNG